MKLLNWQIQTFALDEKTCLAWGVLNGKHPKIRDGAFIHTSTLEKITVEEDKFIVETYSESLYELYFSEISLANIEKTKDGLKLLLGENYNDELIDRIILNKKDLNETKHEVLLNELPDNCLYLEMSEDHVVDALFKHDDTISECHTHIHSGMFSDSTLVILKDMVDFRFFPNCDYIEIYHWSNGLNTVKIKNIGSENLTVCGKETITINAGETCELSQDKFEQEGLFSPDFVDGKSLINPNDD